MVGIELSEEDFQIKSNKYKHFVHGISNYFKYESELFADILQHLHQSDPPGWKEILLAHCFDVSKINQLLKQFNIHLKKCHKISNDKWREQVWPTLCKLVT